MPASSRLTELSRYHYDPLDRQVGCSLLNQATFQRFYFKSRLATEIQGSLHTRIFQHDDQLLAQQSYQSGKANTALLATDQQRSVLSALDAAQVDHLAYTPYGHRPAENGLLSLLGFNGERPDPVTGHYHLGNGYRQFNPVLMRFNSPDSWSPFGEGGLNTYAYCGGDPRNRMDPTGYSSAFFKWLLETSPQPPPLPPRTAPPLPPRAAPPLPPRTRPPRAQKVGPSSTSLPKSRPAPQPSPPLPPRDAINVTPLSSRQGQLVKPAQGLPKNSFLASEDTFVVPSTTAPDHAWFIPVSETRQSVDQLIRQGIAPPPPSGHGNINHSFEPDDVVASNSSIRQQSKQDHQ